MTQDTEQAVGGPTMARRVVSGSALRVVSLAVNVVVAFVVTPIVVLGLGDRMYGLWAVVGTVLGYYQLIEFGLGAAIARYLGKSLGGRDAQEGSTVLSTAMVIYSTIGLLVASVTVAVAVLGARVFDDPAEAQAFRLVMLLMGVNMALTFPVKVVGTVMYVAMRFKLLAVINIAVAVTRAGLIVWALNAGYGIVGLAVASLVPQFASHVVVLVMSKRTWPELKLRRRFVRLSMTRQLLGFSVFGLVSDLGAALKHQIDTIVVAWALGLAAAAHYRIATLLIGHFIKLMLAVVGVTIPRPAQWGGGRPHAAQLRTYVMTTRLVVGLTILVSGGLMALGHAFIARWVGPAYTDVYPALCVLLVAAAVDHWTFPAASVFYAKARLKRYAAYVLADGVLNLVLSVTLVTLAVRVLNPDAAWAQAGMLSAAWDRWGVQPLGMVAVSCGTLLPILLFKLGFVPVLAARVLEVSPVLVYRAILGPAARGLVAASVTLLPLVWFVEPAYGRIAGLAVGGTVGYVVVFYLLEFRSAERVMMVQQMGLPRACAVVWGGADPEALSGPAIDETRKQECHATSGP